MSLAHRISAGAIVIDQGKILLVRYAPLDGETHLVAPGGRVEGDETGAAAAERETREETGVIVAARRPLAVENLLCSQFRMSKTWFLCDVVSGQVQATRGAKEEGIVEAGWFSREELHGQIVFPAILLDYDWAALASPDWSVKWLELRRARF